MDFQTIEECAPTVAPATMQQIIRVESGFKPNVIGYHITKDGRSYRLTATPKTRAEAVTWAKWLLDHGYRFDAGVAQINSNNFKRLGLDHQNIFDACANICASGKILTEFYQGAVRQYGAGQDAVRAAISAYQTGSFTCGWSTGYVGKVTGAVVGTKARPSALKQSAPDPSPFQAQTCIPFNKLGCLENIR